MDRIEIISLGSNCAVKFSIQLLKKNQPTYPFDWIISNDISHIIDVVENNKITHFTDFMNYNIGFASSNYLFNEFEDKVFKNIDKDSLKKLIVDTNTNGQQTVSFDQVVLYNKFKILVEQALKKINYLKDSDEITKKLFNVIVCIFRKNTCTTEVKDTVLIHDHHINTSWKDVLSKYQRRFDRFYELQELHSKNIPILFVRYDFMRGTDLLYEALKKKFKNFYFLVLNHDPVNSQGIFTKIKDNYYSYKGILIFDKAPYHSVIINNFVDKYM